MPITVAAYTPTVAPGPYQATCTDVVEKATKDGNTFRVWEFTTDSGQNVSGASSLSTSPKSKGGKWLAALLGRQPEAGETVDPVNKRCTIIVELDDNGYEKVTTVAPAEAVSPKRRQPVAESVTQDEAAKQLHDDDLPF